MTLSLELQELKHLTRLDFYNSTILMYIMSLCSTQYFNALENLLTLMVEEIWKPIGT